MSNNRINNLSFLFLTLTVLAISNCKSSSSDSDAAPGAAASTVTFSPSSGPVGTQLTLKSETIDLISPTSITVGTSRPFLLSSTTSQAQIIVAGSSSGQVSFTNAAGTSVSTSSSFSVTSASQARSQQGTTLVPSDVTGNGSFGTGGATNDRQGYSVSLSSDGNTAIIGGQSDNTNVGAVWSQQGSKLVANDLTGAAGFGNSVSLSTDGNTAVVGARSNNSNLGAIWIFTRSNSVWTQQGTKIVGTGYSFSIK